MGRRRAEDVPQVPEIRDGDSDVVPVPLQNPLH